MAVYIDNYNAPFGRMSIKIKIDLHKLRTDKDYFENVKQRIRNAIKPE